MDFREKFSPIDSLIRTLNIDIIYFGFSASQIQIIELGLQNVHKI